VTVDVGEYLWQERSFETYCMVSGPTDEEVAEVLVSFSHMIEAIGGRPPDDT
jgi:hypothetical protein